MFVANQASVLFVVISMNHVGLCGCVPTYFTLAKSLNGYTPRLEVEQGENLICSYQGLVAGEIVLEATDFSPHQEPFHLPG